MAVLELESTLTDRYQTTVPAAVRDVLGLGKRDRIGYVVTETSEVKLVRISADRDEADGGSALGPFLALLAKDVHDRPEALAPYDADDAAFDMAVLHEHRGDR